MKEYRKQNEKENRPRRVLQEGQLDFSERIGSSCSWKENFFLYSFSRFDFYSIPRSNHFHPDFSHLLSLPFVSFSSPLHFFSLSAAESFIISLFVVFLSSCPGFTLILSPPSSFLVLLSLSLLCWKDFEVTLYNKKWRVREEGASSSWSSWWWLVFVSWRWKIDALLLAEQRQGVEQTKPLSVLQVFPDSCCLLAHSRLCSPSVSSSLSLPGTREWRGAVFSVTRFSTFKLDDTSSMNFFYSQSSSFSVNCFSCRLFFQSVCQVLVNDHVFEDQHHHVDSTARLS